jgi:hypothetical protein
VQTHVMHSWDMKLVVQSRVDMDILYSSRPCWEAVGNARRPGGENRSESLAYATDRGTELAARLNWS